MFGHEGWMMGASGGMMAGGWLMMLLFWIALILLVVWVVRSLVGARAGSGSSTARETLDVRYARGEITRKEYEQVKKDIGG